MPIRFQGGHRREQREFFLLARAEGPIRRVEPVADRTAIRVLEKDVFLRRAGFMTRTRYP